MKNREMRFLSIFVVMMLLIASFPITTFASNITIQSYSQNNKIYETNAEIWARVDKLSNSSVSKIGCTVWEATGTDYKSVEMTPSKNYVGSTVMYPWFNVNTEVGLTLKQGTTYNYTIYAIIDGQGYSTSTLSFTTTGTKIINATSISINPTGMIMNVGDSQYFSVTVSPSNATNKDYYLTSSDSSVVSYDYAGKVVALKGGSTVITATSVDGGFTASCYVTVNDKQPITTQPIDTTIKVTGISINPTNITMNVGEQKTFSVTVSPSNATNKNYTLMGGDSIISWDYNGKITALKAGTTTIIATSDEGHIAICVVTVSNSSTSSSTSKVNPNISIVNDTAQNVVSNTNAVIYGRVDKPVNTAITNVGCTIWQDGTTQKITKDEKPSDPYKNSTKMFIYYDINSELKTTLKANTKYWYTIYACIDGQVYTSTPSSFTTSRKTELQFPVDLNEGIWKAQTYAGDGHTGRDFSAIDLNLPDNKDKDKPVSAVYDGEIYFINKGSGTIVIKHKSPLVLESGFTYEVWYSIYSHMIFDDKIKNLNLPDLAFLSDNKYPIKKGERLGTISNTHNLLDENGKKKSMEEHLHFALTSYINPNNKVDLSESQNKYAISPAWIWKGVSYAKDNDKAGYDKYYGESLKKTNIDVYNIIHDTSGDERIAYDDIYSKIATEPKLFRPMPKP